jgi:hypothetical protein
MQGLGKMSRKGVVWEEVDSRGGQSKRPRRSDAQVQEFVMRCAAMTDRDALLNYSCVQTRAGRDGVWCCIRV